MISKTIAKQYLVSFGTACTCLDSVVTICLLTLLRLGRNRLRRLALRAMLCSCTTPTEQAAAVGLVSKLPDPPCLAYLRHRRDAADGAQRGQIAPRQTKNHRKGGVGTEYAFSSRFAFSLCSYAAQVRCAPLGLRPMHVFDVPPQSNLRSRA